MTVHVAILKPAFADAVVRGDKTVEARLTKSRRPPWDVIAPNDHVFIKQSAGPYRALARADFVVQHTIESPDALRLAVRPWLERLGPPDHVQRFIDAKADSTRFAVFVGLRDVIETDTGPILPPTNGRAWLRLDAERPERLPMRRTPPPGDHPHQRPLWPDTHHHAH